MSNKIFVVVKRTSGYDEEIAYREKEEDAVREANVRASYDGSTYIIKTKKVFGLQPDND